MNASSREAFKWLWKKLQHDILLSTVQQCYFSHCNTYLELSRGIKSSEIAPFSSYVWTLGPQVEKKQILMFKCLEWGGEGKIKAMSEIYEENANSMQEEHLGFEPNTFFLQGKSLRDNDV